MSAGRDERRHPPGPAPWTETWTFDLIDGSGAAALHLSLTLGPEPGRAAVWTSLLTPGRPTVSLVDHDLAPPAPPGLELRGPGIWLDADCAEPFARWTVGLEAFALTLEDPWEAVTSGRGHRVPLGYDLEWETAGAPVGLGPDAYEVAGTAHGVVLVGDERLDVEGPAWRGHRWGAPSTEPWSRRRGPSGSGDLRVGGRPIAPDRVRIGAILAPDDAPDPLEVVAVAVAPAPAGGLLARGVVGSPGGAAGWLLAGGPSVGSP